MTTRRFRKRTPRKRRGTHILGLSHANIRTGGFMGLEMKFADIETNNDAFANTWATMEDATNASVSGVAQGDGESNRDGRKYSIHSIHIRARVDISATESQTTPLQDAIGRICLVWDTQTNGAQLTATDVMNASLANDELSFRNLQHTKRFRVLWDRSWKINRSNTNEGAVNLFASGFQSTAIFTFNRRFKTPIPVTCSGTTAGIASISDNSLHMIGIGTDTNALLKYHVRLRFTG